jgi:hypothetical protein
MQTPQIKWCFTYQYYLLGSDLQGNVLDLYFNPENGEQTGTWEYDIKMERKK